MRSAVPVPALAVTVALAAVLNASADDRPLTLAEAVRMALEKNEALAVEQEAVTAADAEIAGARGAYDPLLEVSADHTRGNLPLNSAFSGAPEGQYSPTRETTSAGATVEQYLPTGGSVLLSATALKTDTNDTFSLLAPSYDSRLGVEVRQPILRSRATDPARFRIRVAAIDRRFAGASLARETNQTVAAVEDAYWTLAAARRAIIVRERAIELAEQQLHETELRVEAGAAPGTEVAQPRSELERRRVDLFETTELVSRIETGLKRLILADADAALWTDRLLPTDEPDVPVEPVDVAGAMERALATRPELAAGGAVIERRGAESEFARDLVRPALDAVFAYNRYGLAGSINDPALVNGSTIPPGSEGDLSDSLGQIGEDRYDDSRVGLVFRLPIGNRNAKANVAIAESARRQAELDLARARKTVRGEVLDAAAALETAANRIEAATAAREAATTQLSAEQERYAVGLSTNFLVLTRQNDLARAWLDEIRARADYRRALVEMARATGDLLGQHGIELQSEPAAGREGDATW